MYGAEGRRWRIVFSFIDRAAERRCERERRGGVGGSSERPN